MALSENSPLGLGGARGVYPHLPGALRSYLEAPAPAVLNDDHSLAMTHGHRRRSQYRKSKSVSAICPTFSFLYKMRKIAFGSAPRSASPLLQFWHHEVTDPRAKAKPKEGFQRDRGIPGHSKNHMNSYTFLTLTEKLFQAPIQKKDGVL